VAQLVVQAYEEDQLDEVVDLLAGAYLMNPLYLVVFGDSGPDALRQHKTLFAASLPVLNKGKKLVARDGSQIIGFAHWVDHPGCRPGPEAAAPLGPRLTAELASAVLARVIVWRRAWGEEDPDEPHSHFGPFAVAESHRRKGIGRQLLESYCAELDRFRFVGYLETERPENGAIYAKFGFEISSEREVLSLPSWFMQRSQAR